MVTGVFNKMNTKFMRKQLIANLMSRFNLFWLLNESDTLALDLEMAVISTAEKQIIMMAGINSLLILPK